MQRYATFGMLFDLGHLNIKLPSEMSTGVSSELTKCQLLRIPTYGVELFVLDP
jgi:hypothetical protein